VVGSWWLEKANKFLVSFSSFLGAEGNESAALLIECDGECAVEW
jgi:hypothetical protein